LGSTTRAKTLFVVRPVAVQLVPPSVLLKTPWFLVPTYRVEVVTGSTARERTASPGKPLPALAQLAPPFVVLKTPPPPVLLNLWVPPPVPA